MEPRATRLRYPVERRQPCIYIFGVKTQGYVALPYELTVPFLGRRRVSLAGHGVTCQAQHPKANIVLLLIPDLQHTELQAPASQRRFGYSLRYRLTRAAALAGGVVLASGPSVCWTLLEWQQSVDHLLAPFPIDLLLFEAKIEWIGEHVRDTKLRR
jgi:hypothetical protein